MDTWGNFGENGAPIAQTAAATAALKSRMEFQGIQNVIKIGGACSATSLPLGHLYLMGTDSSQSVGVPMREYYTANMLTGRAVTYQDAREVQSIGTRLVAYNTSCFQPYFLKSVVIA